MYRSLQRQVSSDEKVVSSDSFNTELVARESQELRQDQHAMETPIEIDKKAAIWSHQEALRNCWTKLTNDTVRSSRWYIELWLRLDQTVQPSDDPLAPSETLYEELRLTFELKGNQTISLEDLISHNKKHTGLGHLYTGMVSFHCVLKAFMRSLLGSLGSRIG